MENRHHYKYVVIDSSKENHNSVDAKFKVQIPQGITGTTRVCVKSFSMPNSYHNIYGDLKTAKFVGFYRPTSGGDWVYEVFSFNLAEGYTETDNLFSEIQSKFTNASGNEITRESDGSTTVQHVGKIDRGREGRKATKETKETKVFEVFRERRGLLGLVSIRVACWISTKMGRWRSFNLLQQGLTPSSTSTRK